MDWEKIEIKWSEMVRRLHVGELRQIDPLIGISADNAEMPVLAKPILNETARKPDADTPSFVTTE